MISNNFLINSMSPEDADALERHVDNVDLTYRQVLVRSRRRPDYTYFPERCLITIFAFSTLRDQADVSTIGHEGCTAVELALGCERPHHDAIVVIPGRAKRIPVDTFYERMRSSPPLRALLLRYAGYSLVSARQTALANARGSIVERLARWILAASDGIGSPEVRVTHEDLSTSLGVRRAGVTVALRGLADAGMIDLSRGRIEVLDATALIKSARGFYAQPDDFGDRPAMRHEDEHKNRCLEQSSSRLGRV